MLCTASVLSHEDLLWSKCMKQDVYLVFAKISFVCCENFVTHKLGHCCKRSIVEVVFFTWIGFPSANIYFHLKGSFVMQEIPWWPSPSMLSWCIIRKRKFLLISLPLLWNPEDIFKILCFCWGLNDAVKKFEFIIFILTCCKFERTSGLTLGMFPMQVQASIWS